MSSQHWWASIAATAARTTILLLVAGHTNAKGSARYNQRLSERRAEAVKRVLVATFKLPADLVIAVGYGKMQLKNTIAPFAGENRRVRIAALDGHAGVAVVVSNEVGLAIVPDNAMARRFRDLQGRLNARLAARADGVVLMVAGLPQVLKEAREEPGA